MRFTSCFLLISIGFASSLANLLLPLTAQAEVAVEVKLFSDAFISSDFEATARKNYQFLGAGLRTEPRSTDPLHMDLSGAVAFGEASLNYLNITEFYYEDKFIENGTFSVGRRKMNWSDLDSRWGLGLWEPVFKWNPLSPERQGLSGLFWQAPFNRHFDLTLFASPLFFPDQGPSYDIADGSFVRTNPWFHRPPDSIKIFGETTQIEYQLQTPNDAQVVFQTSYGAKLAFGDPQNLYFQVSYTYKPSNQLAIGYSGILDIPKDRGVVDLQPQVFFHHLTGADLSYQFSRFKAGASGLYDQPEQNKIFDDQWTHPVFENALLLSVFTEIQFENFKIYLQRLDVSGGRVTEEGSLASPTRPALMMVYPFRQANEIGLTGHLSFSEDRKLLSTLSYLQDDKNSFSLLKFNSTFRLSRLWSFFGEVQLIDASPITVDNQNEIAQYVNNDRYMIGAGYAF